MGCVSTMKKAAFRSSFFRIFVTTNQLISSMKKCFLTIAILFAALMTMQAQVWLGGNVSAKLNKDTKTFTIAPDVGYCFPNSPFSVACSFEYEGSFINEEDYSHTLTVSPSVRYDICDIGERFTLFVDLSSDIDVLDFGLLNVGLGPGVSFDVTDHWSAEFSIGFLGYNRERAENKSIKHSFNLELKLAAPSFGIYYNF